MKLNNESFHYYMTVRLMHNEIGCYKFSRE